MSEPNMDELLRAAVLGRRHVVEPDAEEEQPQTIGSADQGVREQPPEPPPSMNTLLHEAFWAVKSGRRE
jgi:hypothetical protein